MATDVPIKIQLVKALTTAKPSRIVAVKADGSPYFELWVTDKTGVPFPIKDETGGGGGGTITAIQNTDGNLTITGTTTRTINVSSSLLSLINSALQSGDAISTLINDAGYITLADIPSFNPTDYDLDDFNNASADPFARQSEISVGGAVDSVNGQTGVVVLDADDIEETATRVYITPAEKTEISTAVQPSDLGAVATSNDYGDLDNIPSTFTPSSHTHVEADIIDLDKYTQAQVDTMLATKQGNFIVVSSNKTAVNDEQYSNVASATYTDPTPVEGKGYNVKVVNGTATIGGVGYAEGRIITRTYHSGSWRTKVYVDESIIGSATVTALNGKQNKEDFIQLSSAHSLTNTTALQSITNVAHNVEAGTYRFYCRFSLSGLEGGNISFGSLGTATISIGNWISNANKQNAFPTTNIIAYGSLPSVVKIIGASAGTNGVVTIEGAVTFSSSGTFIPAISLSTAPLSGQTDAGAYTSLIKLS